MPKFLGECGEASEADAFEKLCADIAVGGGKKADARFFSADLLAHVAAAKPKGTRKVKKIQVAQYEVLELYGRTPSDFGFVTKPL